MSVSAAGAEVVFVANVRNMVTICLFAAEILEIAAFCSMAFTSHVKTVSKLFTPEYYTIIIYIYIQFQCSKAISVPANKEISRHENADSDFLSFLRR